MNSTLVQEGWATNIQDGPQSDSQAISSCMLFCSDRARRAVFIHKQEATRLKYFTDLTESRTQQRQLVESQCYFEIDCYPCSTGESTCSSNWVWDFHSAGYWLASRLQRGTHFDLDCLPVSLAIPFPPWLPGNKRPLISRKPSSCLVVMVLRSY